LRGDVSGEGPTTNDGVVLIVDDYAPLARSLVSLCNASGFDARAVHSGAEALAFIRSDVPVALVLLDMSMPDMSGIDVLRAIRAPGGARSDSLPVVMFSADDDQSTRDELTQLGATAFVSKINLSGLLPLVAAYVRPIKPRRP
jgi:two-component system response regulator PrrA